MIRQLIITLCMLLTCAVSQAQTPVTLNPQTEMIPLAGHMSWLNDPHAKLSVESARAAAGWRPLPGELHAGFTAAAVWLRFDVEQPRAAQREWLLEVDNALLDDVRLYQQDADGRWTNLRAGMSVRHSAWPLDTRSPTFRIDLSPGRHPLILRLQARTPLYSAIRLWQPQGHNAMSRSESLALGVYIGMFALLTLFQLFFWISARESVSGAYVVYASLLFLLGLMATGYVQNALDWPGSITSFVFSLALCIILIAGARYSFLQLELPAIMPRLSRIGLRLVGGVSVISCALVLAGYFSLAIGLAQGLALLGSLFMLGLAIVLMRRGHVPAQIFFVSLCILKVGLVIRSLRIAGMLESNLLTDYSFQVSAILHLIIISQFIVYRYNALKRVLSVEQQARQEQQDFVGMVSHEFRTPLAIINTSIEQLAANLHAPPEKTLNRCTNIKNAARRMSDLMDEYLTLDRLESTSSPASLQLQPCRLPKLLADSTVDWPRERIRLTARDLPANFICDARLLQIALRNLLANAHRHSPRDAVIELDVTGDAHGGLLVVVNDHGDGIATDEIPRLFQKYFRGRSAIAKPGAGLGLFLVDRIVGLHGGRVLVTSTLGAGSTFEIRLPAITPRSLAFQGEAGTAAPVRPRVVDSIAKR